MSEPRNRVVQLRRFGGAENLEVIDAPLPTAGEGEVRVRVLASGLEYTDVPIRRHLYPQTAARRPPQRAPGSTRPLAYAPHDSRSRSWRRPASGSSRGSRNPRLEFAAEQARRFPSAGISGALGHEHA